jgi:hypothetical protein
MLPKFRTRITDMDNGAHALYKRRLLKKRRHERCSKAAMNQLLAACISLALCLAAPSALAQNAAHAVSPPATAIPNATLAAAPTVTGYLGGAPTLHILHHRPLNAVGSVGLRLALPALGALIGAGAATCPPAHGDYGNCGTSQAVVGLGAGIVSASIIDASVSWEKPKPEAPGAAQLGFAPAIASDGKHGELRVFGTF